MESLVVGPTITPDEHIKHTDVICIGEGERAFEELIIAVKDKKDYSNIKSSSQSLLKL